MKTLQKKVILSIGVFYVLLGACSLSKEETFKREVAKQNKLYPVMVDEYTRIDSINYTESNNTFRYFYTVMGDADNAAIATQMKEELLKKLPEEIKRAAGMSTHRKHNVIMEYVYYSQKNGNELFNVVITPDMYK